MPLLGDIPILGWLFKTKTVTREKTNLYVFLTPHIVRTQKDAASLYQSKRETMGEVVEGIIKLDERKSRGVYLRHAPNLPETKLRLILKSKGCFAYVQNPYSLKSIRRH